MLSRIDAADYGDECQVIAQQPEKAMALPLSLSAESPSQSPSPSPPHLFILLASAGAPPARRKHVLPCFELALYVQLERFIVDLVELPERSTEALLQFVPGVCRLIELETVCRQFEPYLTAGCVCMLVAPLWCDLGY